MSKIATHWFRQDLRLSDNYALSMSAQADKTILIYILDEQKNIGSASKLWLHHSLNKLNETLNGKLNIYSGTPISIIKKLIEENEISDFYWNRCYDKYSIDRDTKIKNFLQQQNINVKSYNGSLLIEPWQCKKTDNSHFKVYTPFYKQLIKIRPYQENIPKANFNQLIKLNNSEDTNLLKLLTPIHRWQNIVTKWEVGEAASQIKLEKFIKNKMHNYKIDRDFMSENFTSTLSPHLHFGEISPNQIFNAIKSLEITGDNEEHFIKELVWRDFSYYQIYFYPELHNKNINAKFDNFEWQNDPELIKKWQQGNTGIPIVDAGMRELWQTGYMHNRVRMIVASFLVKNCLVHWKYGEKWFFDTLFDADSASNNANWQWVAGCGLDATPYFRIFNPVLQAKKFEAYKYIRKYVPELKHLPSKLIAKPWEASELALQKANIKLGENYPKPIVDIKASRERALEQYKKLK